MFVPIMAVPVTSYGSPYANKEPYLLQSQNFCWATKGSAPPLAWVKMATKSSKFAEACGSKKA
jgi:hypothetical protein